MGIILLLFTALRYLGIARKKENPNEKLINRAGGILFLLIAVQFSLMVLYFLSLEGYYLNHSYMGNPELKSLSLLSQWLWRCSWVPFYMCVAIFVHAGEKIQNKRIPVSLILGIICIFLILFTPFTMVLPTSITFTIVAFFFMHWLFTLMKWARKELKAANSLIILGSFIIIIPSIFANPNIMVAGVVPSLLLPISLITGTILSAAPTILNPKIFLKNTSYWYIFCISGTGYFMFWFIFMILFLPVVAILGFTCVIFFSLECIFFLKSISREEGASKKKNVDVIDIFTRPATITEEEVSVSKERKICLVCKGKMGGFDTFIFMCPDCNAFYCENCARTLIDMENICWVCNSAIDPSRPVKPFEQERQKEVVTREGDPKKWGKVG
jgi:hypothetical protein